MRIVVSLAAVAARDDEEEDEEEEEEPPPRVRNPRKDKIAQQSLSQPKPPSKRDKKKSVKQRCAIFFRTSGGTGLPAIAFDKTRDRINFGVFLARIFDVTSAFDCV